MHEDKQHNTTDKDESFVQKIINNKDVKAEISSRVGEAVVAYHDKLKSLFINNNSEENKEEEVEDKNVCLKNILFFFI